LKLPWILHDLSIAWLPYYSESAGLPIDTVGTIDVDFKSELGTLRLFMLHAQHVIATWRDP
jgi:hypothetical protein